MNYVHILCNQYYVIFCNRAPKNHWISRIIYRILRLLFVITPRYWLFYFSYVNLDFRLLFVIRRSFLLRFFVIFVYFYEIHNWHNWRHNAQRFQNATEIPAVHWNTGSEQKKDQRRNERRKGNVRISSPPLRKESALWHKRRKSGACKRGETHRVFRQHSISDQQRGRQDNQ